MCVGFFFKGLRGPILVWAQDLLAAATRVGLSIDFSHPPLEKGNGLIEFGLNGMRWRRSQGYTGSSRHWNRQI
jgi:hypothetical protein